MVTLLNLPISFSWFCVLFKKKSFSIKVIKIFPTLTCKTSVISPLALKWYINWYIQENITTQNDVE